MFKLRNAYSGKVFNLLANDSNGLSQVYDLILVDPSYYKDFDFELFVNSEFIDLIGKEFFPFCFTFELISNLNQLHKSIPTCTYFTDKSFNVFHDFGFDQNFTSKGIDKIRVSFDNFEFLEKSNYPADIVEPFTDLLIDKTSLKEFEKWVYQFNKLEEYLSNNDYFELISFNYSSSNSEAELKKMLCNILFKRHLIKDVIEMI